MRVAASAAVSSNFYPRPPRGGRRATLKSPATRLPISTHALREEGDQAMQYIDRAGKQFLPTPSARRATGGPPTRPRASSHFYPRPPRGGRLGLVVPQGAVGLFLPTPSARRATLLHRYTIQGILFLPTPSARRATIFRYSIFALCFISTHALREEGDGLY